MMLRMTLDRKRCTRFLLALALCSFVPGLRDARGQTFITPKGEARNVRFEQREEGVVHILYDLVSSDARAVFKVVLEASQDSGSTYAVRPQSVSGDTGDGITPGTGKRIIWDSGKDVERVVIDRFRFRIVATAGPLAAEPTAAAPPSTPTAAPAPAPAAPAPAAAPPAKGGKGKWILIGGGAAAAGGAILALGGGSKPEPPDNGGGVTGGIQLGSIAQSPSGDGIAGVTNFGLTASFSLRAGVTPSFRWTFGDGTTETSQSPTVQHTYQGTGSFKVDVTAVDTSGNIVGTATIAAIRIVSLTGPWGFRTAGGAPVVARGMSLSQSGTTLRGDITFTFGCLVVVTGTVSSSGAVNISFSLPASNGCVPFPIPMPGTFVGSPNAAFDSYSGTLTGFGSTTMARCASNSVVNCP
jgi:hypothetical protein